MNNGQKIQIKVPPTYRGKTLGDFLRDHDTWFAKLDLARTLRDGGFTQSDRVLATDDLLNSHDQLNVFRSPWEERPLPGSLSVIYEDEDLLVVDKWAGFPVTPSGDFYEHSLLHVARKETGLKDLTPVHRLDLETSGVLIFVKEPASRGFYQKAFQEGGVFKKYVALVFGHFDPMMTEIDLPLGRDTQIHTRFVAVASGKQALTRILEVSHVELCSLIYLQPVTGRTNQIRAHLAAVGHPIVGDKKYQKDRQIFFRWLQTRSWEAVREQLRIPNQALHCLEMGLKHRSGEDLCFKSGQNPIPGWLTHV